MTPAVPCQVCGNPVPTIALEHGDNHCSGTCARLTFNNPLPVAPKGWKGTGRIRMHGSSMYRDGCRCETCMEWHERENERGRERRRRAKEVA